ncbi:MAG: hypothetical protein KGH64_00790 [Candidatus Micrarchaeota archaeon]|nr:hypothetical protein [Candidatus Micrarchaeota archaeon]
MGDQAVQGNAEPLKWGLDFEVFLKDLFNSFSGQKSVLSKLDNGQYIVEYERDERAVPTGNVSGGLHIVDGLRLIMNRHSAFGSLTKDEIADVANYHVRAVISPMFAWRDQYGITSREKLHSFGVELFNGLYTYLTSLKENMKTGKGALLGMAESISSVQYVPKVQADSEPQKSMY